jgi:hypothetical protein
MLANSNSCVAGKSRILAFRMLEDVSKGNQGCDIPSGD